MLCGDVLGIQHNSNVPAHCRMPCVRIWTVQMTKLSINLCLCSRHFNKWIIEIGLQTFSKPELQGKNDRPQDPAALPSGNGVHRVKMRSRAGQGGIEKHPTSCQKSNPDRPVQNVWNSTSCYTIKLKTVTYIFKFILYQLLISPRMSNKNDDCKNVVYSSYLTWKTEFAFNPYRTNVENKVSS